MLCDYDALQARVLDILKRHGRDGVEFEEGIPDFGPFAVGEVTMDVRKLYELYLNGARQLLHDHADALLAEKWNADPGAAPVQAAAGAYTAKDVYAFKKAHRYAWNEQNNMHTLELIPLEFIEFFKHMGGIGEFLYILELEGKTDLLPD